MKFRKQKKSNFTNIELAPLIDVICFIVIYFLMNATLQKQASIKIELPTSSNSKQQQKKQDEILVISINKEGKVFLAEEKNSTSIESLVQKLNLFLGPKENRQAKQNQVIIRSDGAANYKRVIEVIDKVNEAGITKFNLATIQNEKSNS